MSKAELIIEEVLRERNRQVSHEGYDSMHDDDHDKGQLAEAAACYAVAPHTIVWPGGAQDDVWPWKPRHNKTAKHPRRKCLIIAAALLVAEIERIDRDTP